jgi:hypothetical protein
MKNGALGRFCAPVVAGALAIAGAAAWSSPASAVDAVFNLRLDGMTSGPCAGTSCATPFGNVTVTGSTTGMLTYTVNLASGVSFLGPGDVFYFDLTDGGGPTITFSAVGAGYSGPVGGSFNLGTDFPGPYNYEVSCTTSSCSGPLTFTASGATSSDPFVIGAPKGGGSFDTVVVQFVADLSVAPGTPNLCPGDSACTGLVGAPEPSTWGMMLIAFAGLGYAGYRRARNSRTAPAVA